jgi:hypothetical protein
MLTASTTKIACTQDRSLSGSLSGMKRRNPLRLFVIENREVRFFEPGHWVPGPVGHHYVEQDVVIWFSWL